MNSLAINAGNSGAEEKFIQLFCDVFGPEKGQYVYLQFPFCDIYGKKPCIFTKGEYSVKDVENLILSMPFKRFEDMGYRPAAGKSCHHDSPRGADRDHGAAFGDAQ